MSSVAASPANPRSRIVIASLIGTSIEFYDFYIYGTAAVLVFPTLFFPNESIAAAQLSSLATFALAFLARPVGSVLFGHFGDRLGRRRSLVASLLITGVATFAIGCLPTFATIGVAAPLLLAILRFLQGVGLGGEWSGAALLAVENAPTGRRGIFGSFPQLGVPIGFLLANGVFIALALFPDTLLTWGWRIPFLLSAVLVFIGLWVRLRLVESHVFTELSDSGNLVRVPIAAVLRRHWRRLITGTLVCVATYVLFYLLTTFTLAYGTAPSVATTGAKIGLGFERSTFLSLMLATVVFLAAAIIVAGALADRIGRRSLLIGVTLGVLIFGLLLQVWFGAATTSFGVFSFLLVGFILMGLSYGPMGALLTELFPTEVRYTGSALVYNLGSVLGASFAPTIALAVWKPDGDITWVGVYLAGAALISFVALLFVPETRAASLRAVQPSEA